MVMLIVSIETIKDKLIVSCYSNGKKVTQDEQDVAEQVRECLTSLLGDKHTTTITE